MATGYVFFICYYYVKNTFFFITTLKKFKVTIYVEHFNMIHSQTTNLLKWKIGSGTAVLVGVLCERDD
jgi:hypothetical protein